MIHFCFMTKISTLGKMKSNDVILKSGQSWYHGSKYIYIFIYIYIYIYIFPISNNTPEAKKQRKVTKKWQSIDTKHCLRKNIFKKREYGRYQYQNMSKEKR